MLKAFVHCQSSPDKERMREECVFTYSASSEVPTTETIRLVPITFEWLKKAIREAVTVSRANKSRAPKIRTTTKRKAFPDDEEVDEDQQDVEQIQAGTLLHVYFMFISCLLHVY